MQNQLFCLMAVILLVIYVSFFRNEDYTIEPPKHIALCFCIRNCEPFLRDVFSNIDALRNRLEQTKVTSIFVYDHCVDKSEELLLSHQRNNENVIVEAIVNESPHRTCRIAKARNKCLDILYSLRDVQYHFMCDGDDACSGTWNIDRIQHSLQGKNDDWDCLSFNRKHYYDMWALMFDDFKHQCWGFSNHNDCSRVIQVMQQEITNKLNESRDDTVEVLSAFNGFAIYKTQRFTGFRYDGHLSSVLPFFTDDERTHLENKLYVHYGIKTKCLLDTTKVEHCCSHNQCCEHLHYHLSAHKQGRKIKISKFEVC